MRPRGESDALGGLEQREGMCNDINNRGGSIGGICSENNIICYNTN